MRGTRCDVLDVFDGSNDADAARCAVRCGVPMTIGQSNRASSVTLPLYAKAKSCESVCALKRSITTQMCLLLSTLAINAPRYYTRLPQHAVNPCNTPSTTRRKMQYPLHNQAQNYLARSTLVPDSVSDQSLTTSSRQPRARIRNICNMFVNTQHEPESAAVSFACSV